MIQTTNILEELQAETKAEIDRFDPYAHMAEVAGGAYDFDSVNYKQWLDALGMPEKGKAPVLSNVQLYLEKAMPRPEGVAVMQKMPKNEFVAHYASFCSQPQDVQDIIYLLAMQQEGYEVPLLDAQPRAAAAYAFIRRRLPEWQDELASDEVELSKLAKADVSKALVEYFTYAGVHAAGLEKALSEYADALLKEYSTLVEVQKEVTNREHSIKKLEELYKIKCAGSLEECIRQAADSIASGRIKGDIGTETLQASEKVRGEAAKLRMDPEFLAEVYGIKYVPQGSAKQYAEALIQKQIKPDMRTVGAESEKAARAAIIGKYKISESDFKFLQQGDVSGLLEHHKKRLEAEIKRKRQQAADRAAQLRGKLQGAEKYIALFGD